MKPRRIRRLIICTGAVILLLLAVLRMDGLAWASVGIMCALGIATGIFSFRIDSRTTVTFGPAVFLGAVALFGGLVGVCVAAFSTLFVELARFRRAAIETVVRAGVETVAVFAAATAYLLAGGRTAPGGLSIADGARFLLMFAVYAAVSGVLTAIVKDSSDDSPGRYFRWLSGRGVIVELAMLPLALLLVASYIPGEPATFPLLAVVLIISSAAGQKLWETQETLLQRVSELKTLNSVSTALSCSLRLDDLVRLVHSQTFSQLDAPVLAVGLYNGATTEMQMKACFSGDCELPSWTSTADDSCSSWVILNREALYIPDFRRDRHRRISPFFTECASERGLEIRSWLGIPLVADGELIGILSVSSDKPRAFEGATHELFQTLGSQVGKVIDNMRLYEKLRVARESAEDWTVKLEQSVKERTAELEEARHELENLNVELEARVERRTRELKHVQDKIVESGRLAAVGELAAGVAHELNNPLAGVLGYAQYDLEKLKKKDSVDEETRQSLLQHLTFVERETQRCRQIVENLLKFAQTSKCATSEIDVNALLTETLGFTDRELTNRGIELRTEIEDEELSVVADPRQLQQVFANIILNARKAMPSGGRLSIRSRRVARTEKSGHDVVAISFGDTGCGIAEENLGRIFEPFFRTGPVGEGTGLGLSVSYGIVKDHGGNIEVESRVGTGSTFTVLLPLAGSENPEPAIQEAV